MLEDNEKEQIKYGIVPYQEFMKDQYFKRWYPIWIRNAMENYNTIKEEFRKKDHCLSSLPRPMNRPAMILGGGPSLDKVAPLLKDWKNPIFSPSTTAFIPTRWGRKPEYICAFDSLWSTYDKNLELNKKFSWNGSTLLTHPNAEPKMIKAWKWDKYYYRRVWNGHEFFEHTFPLMYPWIRVGLKFSGNVVNNALTIAAFLGYNPIILVGVDLGWKDDDMIKATNWRMVKGEWEQQPNVVNKEAMKRKEKLLVTAPNGTRTFKNYISFKDGLLDIVSSNKGLKVIDCSNGMLDEFPKITIEQMIDSQGWGDYGYHEPTVRKKVKDYLKLRREGKPYFIEDKKNNEEGDTRKTS